MKPRKKILISIVAILVIVGTAFLFTQGAELQGRFSLEYWQKLFPGFKCGRKLASIVVSDVTSEVPSEVTTIIVSEVPSKVTTDGGTTIVTSKVPSEVSSWVTSLVTSKVPQCVPKKKK